MSVIIRNTGGVKSFSSMKNNCTGCKQCIKDCDFLKKYGFPGEIAENILSGATGDFRFSFECSLCGLCTAVCPEKLDPSEMFLEIRREAVKRGEGYFPQHKILLSYEKRGNSRLFNYYALPQNCDTIFFPGCAMTGTRSEKTYRIYKQLKKHIPSAGIVLDCCNKPSHDLGRQDYFNFMFLEMRDYLIAYGVRKVITACPSCYRIFDRYGDKLKAVSLYDIIRKFSMSDRGNADGEVVIHDPCSSRFNVKMQDSVRDIVKQTGLKITEMRDNRSRTLCCGEGGGVGFISPGLTESWRKSRKENSGGRSTITYCAGCVEYLKKTIPISHLVDLIFEPEPAVKGKPETTRSPFTYIKRLLLKRKLKKESGTSTTRERNLKSKDENNG